MSFKTLLSILRSTAMPARHAVDVAARKPAFFSGGVARAVLRPMAVAALTAR